MFRLTTAVLVCPVLGKATASRFIIDMQAAATFAVLFYIVYARVARTVKIIYRTISATRDT